MILANVRLQMFRKLTKSKESTVAYQLKTRDMLKHTFNFCNSKALVYLPKQIIQDIIVTIFPLQKFTITLVYLHLFYHHTTCLLLQVKSKYKDQHFFRQKRQS